MQYDAVLTRRAHHSAHGGHAGTNATIKLRCLAAIAAFTHSCRTALPRMWRCVSLPPERAFPRETAREGFVSNGKSAAVAGAAFVILSVLLPAAATAQQYRNSAEHYEAL